MTEEGAGERGHCPPPWLREAGVRPMGEAGRAGHVGVSLGEGESGLQERGRGKKAESFKVALK